MTYPTSKAPKQTAAREPHDPNKYENPDRELLDNDARLDKDLEETFPASDSPATSGVTKIDSSGDETGKPRHHTPPAKGARGGQTAAGARS